MSTVDLSSDELNLILSTIGIALNIVQDNAPRQELLDLQSKLMKLRDGED